MMRSARTIALGTLVLVVAGASIAFAAGTITVTRRGPATVDYPKPVQLTVAWSELVAAPIELQVRYPGSDWTTFRTISASRAVESTRPTSVTLAKPRAAYEVRAVQGSLESSIATGAVRAALTLRGAPGSLKANVSTFTVSGSIAPTHSVGTTVTVKLWKAEVKRPPRGHGRPVLVRTLVGEYAGSVSRTEDGKSFWSVRVPTPPKGVYEVRAYHQDAEHARSASRPSSLRVR